MYGQWHGHPTNDRRLVSIDLGLVISHDGLFFHEPVPDFRLVSAAEDDFLPPPAEMSTRTPALMQGQGFANVGDHTLFWYAPWPEPCSDGVRLARWARDRLGFLTAQHRPSGKPPACVVSRTLRGVSALSVNAGCGNLGSLRLELLNEAFDPIPGFAGLEHGAHVSGDGLAVPVEWP